MLLMKEIVRKTYTDGTEMAVGVDTTGLKELKKAIKFFNDLGVSFARNGEAAPKGITVYIKDVEKVNVKAPFIYEMGMEYLISLYRLIKTTGLSGRLIIQALTDAIQCLEPEVYTGVAHREGETNGVDILKIFVEYINEFLKIHHVPHRQINFATANSIYLSLGGFKGCKKIFMEAFKKVYIALENGRSSVPVSYHACNVCKRCKITTGCEAFCGKALIPVPENMTIEEAGQVYNDVIIHDGKVFTEWIVEDIADGRCQHFKDRRPNKR